mmetsp:Transcript_32156/g.75512  ORF Transcript_32156/g.75512 Transcript_32156/m.75512 type:complete len:559 (+) Transcript_32156:141-1817(+)
MPSQCLASGLQLGFLPPKLLHPRIASAFPGDDVGDDGDDEVLAEEVRSEPPWWRQKIIMARRELDEIREKELSAVVLKAAHERAVKRAFVKEQLADTETSRLRKELQKHQPPPPLDTVEDMKKRLEELTKAHTSVDVEKAESSEMLRHDDQADLYRKFLLRCQDVEKRYEDAEDEALRQGEKIMERSYNTAPDAPASNCQGLLIKTRETCEDELNTVFVNGKCYVAGGEMGVEKSPEEAAAELQASASSTILDQLLRKANYTSNILSKLRKREPGSAGVIKFESLLTKTENEIEGVEGKYREELQALLKVQKQDLVKKEEELAKLAAELEDASRERSESRETLAKIDDTVVDELSEDSRELDLEARHEGFEQSRLTKHESEDLRFIRSGVEGESLALRKGDDTMVSEMHHLQERAVEKEHRDHELSLREAGSSGLEHTVKGGTVAPIKQSRVDTELAMEHGSDAYQRKKIALTNHAKVSADRNALLMRIERTTDSLNQLHPGDPLVTSMIAATPEMGALVACLPSLASCRESPSKLSHSCTKVRQNRVSLRPLLPIFL